MTDINRFYSVWTQPSDYWLLIESAAAAALSGFAPVEGMAPLHARKVGPEWATAWEQATAALASTMPDTVGIRAGVLAGEQLPPNADITRALRTVAELNQVAAHLWLLSDIHAGRLGCYMQPVVDRRGKRVGFEAFARMESADGGIIGGGAIMQAARALNSEYQVDRVLHKHAIETFASCDLDGYLFINFLTGFIQRPEVYFDGLSQAVSRSALRPNAIVLDVPLTDYARDPSKLISIADYCRSRGFALALDDVSSPQGLPALLADIRPAFVKLDGAMAATISDAKRTATLKEMVRIAHASGANMLAEGVESQAVYDAYLAADIDLFQGYLIGAPKRYDAALARQAKA